jgi:hypothetical protein
MAAAAARPLLRPSAVQLLRNLHRAPPGAILERLELEARASATIAPRTTVGEGGLLLWPQEVISQIDRVDAAVDLLWNELENRSSAPGAPAALVELRSTFNAWRDKWKLWRNKNRDYWSLFWAPGGIQTDLATWERTLDAWREKVKALGVETIAPKPPPPPAPSPVLQTVDNLSYAAMAVAAAVGLFIVVRTVKGGVLWLPGP